MGGYLGTVWDYCCVVSGMVCRIRECGSFLRYYFMIHVSKTLIHVSVIILYHPLFTLLSLFTNPPIFIFIQYPVRCAFT
jgi:hypothetical protein